MPANVRLCKWKCASSSSR